MLLMFRMVMKHVKHLATAVMLLALGIVAAEIYLQCEGFQQTNLVCNQVDLERQHTIVPSQTTHHEMRRMATINGPTPTDGEISFSTNSFGLRGDEPAIPKPQSVFRILLLGDDTILGTGLNSEDLVSSRVAQLLSEKSSARIEVINAAVPGYSPLLSEIQFEQELHRLQPNLVILHFDMSDIADDVSYRRHLKTSDTAWICSNPALVHQKQQANLWKQIRQRSALAAFFHEKTSTFVHGEMTEARNSRIQSLYEWTTESPPDLQAEISKTLESVSRLNQSCATRGISLRISTVPVFWQVTSPELDPELARSSGVFGNQPVTRDIPFRILQAYCDQNSILFCNPVQAFREFPEPESLFESNGLRPELSRYGAALYAREIVHNLMSGQSTNNRMTGAPASGGNSSFQ